MYERPHVICHMVTSLDGKVAGDFLKRKETGTAEEIYYRIHREYNADAFACGRVTMEGSFTGGWYPDLSPYSSAEETHEDCIAQTDARFFAVAFDRRGRLGWKEAVIHDEDPGYDHAHIIEVLEEAEPAYLSYLREKGISYIFAKDRFTALVKLRKLFGIQTLLLEGGSLINGAFARDGLIDELSLVTAPISGGPNDAPLFHEGTIQNFEMTDAIKEEDSVLWVRWRKK